MTLTGDQLRAARESAGLSRRGLSTFLTNMTEHQVLNVERGRPLTADEEAQLLEVFRERFHVDLRVEPEPAVTGAAVFTAAVVERVQVAAADRSWAGSTQTSVPLGPVRTGPIRQFSNSELADALDCPRRWWLRWYRGLTPLLRSPLGLMAIGDRVHRALQCWYVPEGETPVHPSEALERLIVEDWSAIVEADIAGPDMVRQFNVEANLERAMIAGYFEWLTETGEDDGLVVVAPEQYVEGTLMTPDEDGVTQEVRLIGKLDVRVVRESDGKRMFIDHKTVGEFARARFKVNLGDPQMLTYHLLEWLDTEEGDARCEGALYNMLRRVKRSVQAKPPFYERIPVPHNVHQIESHRTQVEGQVHQVLSMEAALAAGLDHRAVAYPHKTSDCQWKCQFSAVCPMFDDGSRAEGMLAQLYTVQDPLSYYQGSHLKEETT